MVMPHFRRSLLLVALVAALATLPLRSSFGQEPPRLVPRPSADLRLPAATPIEPMAAAPQQGDFQALLPLVVKGISATPLQFASSVVSGTNELNDPSTTFDYGIQRLYASTLIEGAQNQPWRLEWTVDDSRNAGLDTTGTITSQTQRITRSICLAVKGVCTSAIPRGKYHVDFFVNNELVTQGTAEIK